MYTKKFYCVYIMASKKRGVLYIGFSGQPDVRVYQHKAEVMKGFTSRYHVKRLVYYEFYADAYAAIRREKQLKKWKREWKIHLIEQHNPEWIDLYDHGKILPLPIGGGASGWPLLESCMG